MIPAALELEKTINEYYPKLRQLDKDNSVIKPSPTKWSKKELIGHLIDSAQNNIRRFIVAQYEETPKITYQQDNWVRINNYQECDLEELVQLWFLFNKQAVHILKKLPADAAERTCETESVHSITWLASDYIKHLKHHLHQILDMSDIAYP